MYFECLWIGTPFEKQKHLACASGLVYNPRKHRCDSSDEFEAQFEQGVYTANDLLEFMRFRNCVLPELSASTKLSTLDPQKMKSAVEKINSFLNRNVLAKARLAMNKNKKYADNSTAKPFSLKSFFPNQNLKDNRKKSHFDLSFFLNRLSEKANVSNRTVIDDAKPFRLRNLLSIEETTIESEEVDVTDAGYQDRDQAVSQLTNELKDMQVKQLATSPLDIEAQIEQHLRKKDKLKPGFFDRKPPGSFRMFMSPSSDENRLNDLTRFLHGNKNSYNNWLRKVPSVSKYSKSSTTIPTTTTTSTTTTTTTTSTTTTSTTTTTATTSTTTEETSTARKFTQTSTRNKLLQTYIISQTKSQPTAYVSRQITTGSRNVENESEKHGDHNLIECKDNDFGLECSCSITLSPPDCKKLINSFLSSCRIVGCKNNGRCINMTSSYPSRPFKIPSNVLLIRSIHNIKHYLFQFMRV